MKNSKLNTHYIFWVSKQADTANLIIGVNRPEWNIWPIFLLMGVGCVLL